MNSPSYQQWVLIPPNDMAVRAGLRFGDKGTHTSRTIMLSELRDLLASIPQTATRQDYSAAIIYENVLGKSTAATRRLTNQRLGELYALDPKVPVFQVFRRLWMVDVEGRPLLALLCALGRDPLLRITAPKVLSLKPGEELGRTAFRKAIGEHTKERLNEAILDKVARNAGSSWTQSGHLQGRVRKVRRQVQPTPGAIAFALWLGSLFGYAGEQLLTTPWTSVFDRSPRVLLDVVLKAKELRLLQARIGGDVVEIDLTPLDRDMEGARR